MADQNAKCSFIQIELGTRGFLESLMTNLESKFRNSKWRIKYGGQILIHNVGFTIFNS